MVLCEHCKEPTDKCECGCKICLECNHLIYPEDMGDYYCYSCEGAIEYESME